MVIPILTIQPGSILADDSTDKFANPDTSAWLLRQSDPTKSAPILAFTIVPGKMHAITGGGGLLDKDYRIRLWDLKSMQVLRTYNGHQGRVRCLACSSDGRFFVSASEDGTAVIWETESVRPFARLEGHAGPVMGVTFTPNGRQIVTGGRDKTVRIWDASTGVELKQHAQHKELVNCVAVSPDGSFILSGADRGEIFRWNMQAPESVRKVRAGYVKTNFVIGLRITSDGKQAFVAAHDRIRLIDASTGAPLTRDPSGYHDSPHFGMTSDNRYVISGDKGSSLEGDKITIELFESKSAKEVHTYDMPRSMVYGADFLPDGKSAVTASSDGILRVWKLPEFLTVREHGVDPFDDRNSVFTFNVKQSDVSAWAVSSNGTVLATGTASGEVQLTDLQSLEPLRPLAGLSGLVRDLAFSQNGTELWGCSINEGLVIWDTASGMAKTPPAGIGKCSALAVSADSRTIAVGNDDGSIQIIDAVTKRLSFKFSGHKGRVADLVFFPNSNDLGSGGEDGTSRVWSVETRREKQLFTLAEGRVVDHVDVAPDGTYLLATSSGENPKGLITVWNLHTESVLSASKSQLNSFGGTSFLKEGMLYMSSGKGLSLYAKHRDSGEGVASVENDPRDYLAVLRHPTKPGMIAFKADGSVSFVPNAALIRVERTEHQPRPREWKPPIGRVEAELSRIAARLSKLSGEFAKRQEIRDALTWYDRSMKVTSLMYGEESEEFLKRLESSFYFYQQIGDKARMKRAQMQALRLKAKFTVAKGGSESNESGIKIEMSDEDRISRPFVPGVDDHLTFNQFVSRGRPEAAFQSMEYKVREAVKENGLVGEASRIANNLAVTYSRWSMEAEADELFDQLALLGKLDYPFLIEHAQRAGRPEQVIEILEQRATKVSVYDRSLDNKFELGKAYKNAGQYEKAAAVLAEVVEKRKESQERYGSYLGEYRAAQLEYADAEAAQGHWQKALPVMLEACRDVRAYTSASLPVLSEREQLNYLQREYHTWLHRAYTMGLHGGGDPGTASQSAECAINSKGIVLDVLGQKQLISRLSQSAEVRKALQELTQVRAQISEYASRGALGINSIEEYQKYRGLVAKEETFSARLGELTGTSLEDDPWREIDDVRKAIPADAALIVVSNFRVKNFRKSFDWYQWFDNRYVAWIIPHTGDGDVQLVDLGPTKELSPYINPFSSSVSRFKRSSTANLTETPTTRGDSASEEMRTLSQKLLHPLETHISRYKHWIISPDSELWTVSWAALSSSSGRFVIEDHPVSYVVSPRKLLEKPSSAATGAPLIFADPDFGSDPGAPLRLPGTRREAERIAPHLERYARAKPKVFLQSDATEERFKSAVQPKVVIFSTHGYYDTYREGSGNPLALGGVILAGAKGKRGTGNNGYLTGLEILSSNLKGTKLVILSACETGVGKVEDGEGVSSLRQAFQLAGAEAVMATLWAIPDEESADLMIRFFERLTAGDSKAEALRQAQLHVMKTKRHPSYWAGFTLTGDWR